MSNDEHSFSEIVRTYQKPLYLYIRRMVGVHEDAEDILQETFTRAFRWLWTLRSPESLKPWLFRIATNEVHRHFKKMRLPLDYGCDDMDVPAVDDDPADMMLLRDAQSKLPAAISGLSVLQREVFCMKYYEGMDYDQISAITGAGKNTLMVSYHQAKEKIKKKLL